MTQQEKQILLKDLCARIPYHTLVQLNPGAYNKPETCILTGVDGEQVYLNIDSDPFRIDHIKPYLRPMSSMTEKEKEEIGDGRELAFEAVLNGASGYCPQTMSYNTFNIDYCNAHHLDHRGLIHIGLALEAPDGMYKTE